MHTHDLSAWTHEHSFGPDNSAAERSTEVAMRAVDYRRSDTADHGGTDHQLWRGRDGTAQEGANGDGVGRERLSAVARRHDRDLRPRRGAPAFVGVCDRRGEHCDDEERAHPHPWCNGWSIAHLE